MIANIIPQSPLLYSTRYTKAIFQLHLKLKAANFIDASHAKTQARSFQRIPVEGGEVSNPNLKSKTQNIITPKTKIQNPKLKS